MKEHIARRETVRQRANFACEFCGIAETDTDDVMTLDHYCPQSRGGENNADNLIYACRFCNEFKINYWPQQPGDQKLWNPRNESRETHFIAQDDGTLLPITDVGRFTLGLLCLNRPALIALRARNRRGDAERHYLMELRDAAKSLRIVRQRQAILLAEQQALLTEQRTLLENHAAPGFRY